MVEDVTVEGDWVSAPSGLGRGANFHPRGADARAGEKVLEAGLPLGAAEVGLAAALGMARLRVHRRPRVALLSTGDELVEVGEEPGPGQIVDSNPWALLAALREAGAEVSVLGLAPDRPEALREMVVDALRDHMVLVTSGGVAVGTHD